MSGLPVRSTIRATAVGLAAALVAALVAGCAEDKTASFSLNVVFPSTALAIACDEVKFIVFDDPNPGACQRIYLKRITNQPDLPPVVLDAAPVPVCDVALGRTQPLELPVGKHSILAVATREKQDLLVGCADVALSSDGGEVFVDLALPGATLVPPLSSCLSLRDACEKRCE
ncbi:MAG: hypothetical protein JWP87_397 [Labilithrix sp.]|nr:hypothetical protein [Labilithrix sp.]